MVSVKLESKEFDLHSIENGRRIGEIDRNNGFLSISFNGRGETKDDRDFENAYLQALHRKEEKFGSPPKILQ